ncbi:hypothetical protein GF389_06145 [Candidatus Dojkabacteria bacterium]|nr:hypothetical protein [Candidatus Dojkabacteria bacterium]
MAHKEIKIESKKILSKFFQFNRSIKNYILRTKKVERELLTSLLESTKISEDEINFAEENCKRDGCYSIIGLSENTVFKLISGRRYENKFVLLNKKELEQIKEDYYTFYKYLKKSQFTIPKSIATYTIELDIENGRRHLFLEHQERFAEDNLLNLYNNKAIGEKQLIKEFRTILKKLPSIFPYIGKDIGFDVVIPNFLPNGKFIDLLPPKVTDGYEHKLLKKTYYSEYSRIKVDRMFNPIGVIAHLIASFSVTTPDLIEDYTKEALTTFHKTEYYNKLRDFLLTERFRLYLHYATYYFRNLARPTLSEDEITGLAEKIHKFINKLDD